jgi:hypothetical protein
MSTEFMLGDEADDLQNYRCEFFVFAVIYQYCLEFGDSLFGTDAPSGQGY